MFASKKIVALIVIGALFTGSIGFTAPSAQETKKIAERKAKRTKEKTKSKAKAKTSVIKNKPKIAQKSAKKQVAVKKPVVKKSAVKTKAQPIKKSTAQIQRNLPAVYPVQTNAPNKPLPPLPIVEDEDMIPTDMPSRPIVPLLAMLPDYLQNRVENIIVSSVSDPETLFKNLYLLAWVDDELMKKFNSSDFYMTLLNVIAHECNVPQAHVEAMATAIKNNVDATLVRFENAIVAGDQDNFDGKSVRDLFKAEDSYSEYLDRCLRLAGEYKQRGMETLLKLALTSAKSGYNPSEDDDF